MTFSLHQEEKDLLDKSSAYEQLVASPAWKLLLDFFEARCNASLARLRGSASSDAHVNESLRLAWKRDEAVLADLQAEVLGTIARRRDWLEELAATRISREDFEREIAAYAATPRTLTGY
jgi:hypothetical protein